MSNIDTMTELAYMRLEQFVNRSAGQHMRAMREMWGDATTAQPEVRHVYMPFDAGNFYPPTPDEIPLTGIEVFLIYAGLSIGAGLTVAIFVGAAGWVVTALFT